MREMYVAAKDPGEIVAWAIGQESRQSMVLS